MEISTLPSGRYRLRTRHPVTRKYIALGTYDTAEEAELNGKVQEARLAEEAVNAHAAARRAAAAGLPAPLAPAPKCPTFDAYAESWLTRKDTEAATRKAYQSHIRGLIKEGFGGKVLNAITTDDVEHYMVNRRAAGMSDATRRQRLTTMRVIMRDAVRRGVLALDPTAGVAKPREQYKVERVVSDDEFAQIMAQVEEFRRPFFLVMFMAGLRYAEAAAITAGVVDNGSLLVAATILRDGTMRWDTKGHRRRNVPLLPELETALRQHMLRYPGGAEEPIFRNEDGNPLTYRSTAKVWERAVIAAELDPAQRPPTMHDLRHSFATRLAEAGTYPKEIAGFLGHADTKTTERYTHRASSAVQRNYLMAAFAGRTPLVGEPVAVPAQRRLRSV